MTDKFKAPINPLDPAPGAHQESLAGWSRATQQDESGDDMAKDRQPIVNHVPTRLVNREEMLRIARAVCKVSDS